MKWSERPLGNAPRQPNYCNAYTSRGIAQEMMRVYTTLMDEVEGQIKTPIEEKPLVYISEDDCKKVIRDIRRTRSKVESADKQLKRFGLRPDDEPA